MDAETTTLAELSIGEIASRLNVQLLTIDQVARLLRVHHVTVRRMLDRGELTRRHVGKKVFVSAREVAALVGEA